ncbi:hypothetical protein SCA6_007313 [Theobroma cacao]
MQNQVKVRTQKTQLKISKTWAIHAVFRVLEQTIIAVIQALKIGCEDVKPIYKTSGGRFLIQVHWDEFEQQPVSLVASPVQFERENNQTITSVDYIKLLTMDLLSTGRMDMLVLSAKEVVPIVDSMRDLVSVSALMDLIPEL